jgi:hypothetical protein
MAVTTLPCATALACDRQQGSSTPNIFNAGQTPYRLALLALAISPCHLLWMGLGTLNIFSKSTPLPIDGETEVRCKAAGSDSESSNTSLSKRER